MPSQPIKKFKNIRKSDKFKCAVCGDKVSRSSAFFGNLHHRFYLIPLQSKPKSFSRLGTTMAPSLAMVAKRFLEGKY